MAVHFQEKRVNEAFTVELDFTNILPTGRSVASGTVGAIDTSDGSNADAILGSTTATIDSNKAQVRVLNGSTNKLYKAVFVATLDNADTLEGDIFFRVDR